MQCYYHFIHSSSGTHLFLSSGSKGGGQNEIKSIIIQWYWSLPLADNSSVATLLVSSIWTQSSRTRRTAALLLLMTCRCSQKVGFHLRPGSKKKLQPRQRQSLNLTADVLLFLLVLYAIKEDSEKVPTLLTDYILKGEFSICHFCSTNSQPNQTD